VVVANPSTKRFFDRGSWLESERDLDTVATPTWPVVQMLVDKRTSCLGGRRRKNQDQQWVSKLPLAAIWFPSTSMCSRHMS
jgi:hypothetical protein